MLKKVILGVICILLVSLIFSFNGLAQDKEYIDPEIPDSWYEAPDTASEMGLSEFNQSPVFKTRVDNGELPPVEERLPDDPPVLEPYQDIGQYGGTANMWGTQFTWGFAQSLMEYNGVSSAGQPTPDGTDIIPWFIKDWEYSNNYQEYTIYLREGMKWSDGEPLTADDYLWWWEYVANNKELNQVSPEKWAPVSLIDVTSSDKYTVTFHLGDPFPTKHRIHNQQGILPYTVHNLEPAHFMKQFHPEIIGEDKAKEMAEEVELEEWYEYYDRMLNSDKHPEYDHQKPTINPWVCIDRTETELIYEPNPYYPFIDTEGNQLPYIEEVRINLANDKEMASAKASTGEATMSWSNLEVDQIPLYKNSEDKGNYRTLIYYKPLAADVAMFPNMTHEDSEWRELFRDDRFRKALSLAINRDNINNKIYFGEGTPGQATVPPTSDFYKEEYANSYADYNPEKAKELLDEMGMVDVNDDGYRETPQGEKFNPEIMPTTWHPIGIFELVKKNWDDIGINTQIKTISEELLYTRRRANNFDLGAYHIDNQTLNFGSIDSMKGYAPVNYLGPWPNYANWYGSGGDSGEEPPEKYKKLIDWYEDAAYHTDEKRREEAAYNLLESQAENIWVIGTVGMVPQPVIVKNEMKNVPEKGYIDYGTKKMGLYRPMQYYIEE